MNLEPSEYIVIPVVAWVLSQILKYFAHALATNSLKDLSSLYKSGNMPSSHAALMVSLLVTIGLKDGINSALFGAVLVIAMIVVYDAINVRRAVGEQGLVLADLLKQAGVKKPFYTAMGHKLTEVLVGSIVGSLTAVILLRFL